MGPDFRVRTLVRRCLAAAMALVLPACSSMTAIDSGKVGSDVLSTLRARGSVPVAIALVEPAGYGSPQADTSRLRAEIARLQQQVLSRLDERDFRLGSRFQNVPAISGTLLTEQGLEVLVADSTVRRIDVDVGGGGSRIR